MTEPKVIYENKDFLAVDKPAGLLVHGIKVSGIRYQVSGIRCQVSGIRYQVSGEGERTLTEWLLKKYPEIGGVGDEPNLRPGIVHRLDKDTSGVMIVARNQKSFLYFKSLFQKHQIKKTYLALVSGKLEPKIGEINKPIGIKSGTIRHSVFSKKMVKEAVTEYKVLKYVCAQKNKIKGEILNKRESKESCFSLVEILPKTGRTHQIRVHLASVGHPVLGDSIYGGKNYKKNFNSERLMLHALSLEFTSPGGDRLKIEAEPPKELSTFDFLEGKAAML